MKKRLVLTMALVCAVILAYAPCGMCGMWEGKGMYKGMGTDEMCDMKMQKMTERLGLTEEQVEQIKPIMMEKMEKKKELMEDNKAEMDAIRDEYSAQIDAILTDEQKAENAAWKEEMKAMKMEHKGMMMEKKGAMMEEKGAMMMEEKTEEGMSE